MAEIKFTAERMAQVRERLGEMTEQLQTSIVRSNNLLENISGNVQGDNISNVLIGFMGTSNDKTANTVKSLTELKNYLDGKITQYQRIDQSGIENLTEVQNLLNQLES